tara:strand:+ start:21803 stop:22117 length:315 start_codon:yes stop_codon:yes gene_type:complete
MKKKQLHKAPMEYRVCYRITGAVESSTQYYNVYHSSEALDFLAHTFRKGHIHGHSLTILAVEEWNRFSRTWEDRTSVAALHCEAEELITQNDKTYLRPCQTSAS